MLRAYTIFHVVISMIGIVAGFVVVGGLIANRELPLWTEIFLWTTVATSVTGFFFPYKGFKPGYVLGVLSLVALGLAISARSQHQLAGVWRGTFAIGSIVALYFNFFVLIVQAFRKVPALTALAPTETEPPFKIAHKAALILFLVLGMTAVMRFHP